MQTDDHYAPNPNAPVNVVAAPLASAADEASASAVVSNKPQNATAPVSSSKTAPLSKTTKQKSNSLTPSISILTINEVSFLHVGNYTCAPSNAKQASITVHVLRGNFVQKIFRIYAIK